MTAATIMQMILWLAPQTTAVDADWYARSIVAATTIWDVDPVDVLARIQTESMFDPRAVSRWDDYGLLQLHVSKSTRPEYLGREKELLDPQLNIWLGVKALRYWRDRHWAYCRGAHLYVAHYKWGNHVKPGWGSTRFLKFYFKLINYHRRQRRRIG